MKATKEAWVFGEDQTRCVRDRLGGDINIETKAKYATRIELFVGTVPVKHWTPHHSVSRRSACKAIVQ
jgi:hypothetical protein